MGVHCCARRLILVHLSVRNHDKDFGFRISDFICHSPLILSFSAEKRNNNTQKNMRNFYDFLFKYTTTHIYAFLLGRVRLSGCRTGVVSSCHCHHIQQRLPTVKQPNSQRVYPRPLSRFVSTSPTASLAPLLCIFLCIISSACFFFLFISIN